MYVINKIASPGEIKCIKLTPESVIIQLRSADGELVYKRVTAEEEVENAGYKVF